MQPIFYKHLWGNKMKKIVILTGAGISADSGVSTFRDNNGLWENHRIEDVATADAFIRNPNLVYQFYNQRRSQLNTGDIHPNAAHFALAQLEKQYKQNLIVVTQNVDNLHERAGTKNILHMHGELNKVLCNHCQKVSKWTEDLTKNSVCPSCHEQGKMRPYIVWFGEMPIYMDVIERKLLECDLFVSIGTSGSVYPAAGFVELVRTQNPKAHTLQLNKEPSKQNSLFAEKRYGKANEIVPAWVKELLIKPA